MNDTPVRAHVDRETAFALYLGEAGRSYLRLNQLTGVPLGTIRSWARFDSWSDRADALDEQARAANRRHVLRSLDIDMPRALATIRDSMGSENPRVALDAAARWVELWGKYRGLVLETGQDAGEEDDVADIPDDQLFAELKRRVR